MHGPCTATSIDLVILLLWPYPASADTLTGKVVKITDGDTLYVLDANSQQHKIRLAGIDAPERKQAYGLASRKHLASTVAGKQVTIEYHKRDRYLSKNKRPA
ncbi:MAG: thermonuclease family protein [Acidiferrobacterales bacterium]